MSEDVKTEVKVENKTEVEFKEKFPEKVKKFWKKNGKKIGAGALAVGTAVGGFIIGKKFFEGKDDDIQSWTDEDGSHVSFIDGGNHVEVIETPIE